MFLKYLQKFIPSFMRTQKFFSKKRYFLEKSIDNGKRLCYNTVEARLQQQSRISVLTIPQGRVWLIS